MTKSLSLFSLGVAWLLLLGSPARAFEWPGGTMSVPVVFRGQEVFAGWVPSSPWGSTAFLSDPVVELRDAAHNVIAQQVITGSLMHWYQGGTRNGTAVFSVSAGTYFLTTTDGVRLIRIPGEGWSGFRLVEESITNPVPPNSAPTITWVSAPASAGHGEGYTITARGYDADGNLSQVNVWKDGQPFAFAGGGTGIEGESGNPTSDAGPRTVTFTAQAVDAEGAASPVITHVVTIDPPLNTPPTVTLLAPLAQTVTVGTNLTISARATDPDGNLSGHNLDIQRPAGDWNFQGGFATGEPYQGGPVGSGADSTRTAGFTFSDPGTYHIRSGAYDGSGWYHSATVAVTVVSPPPMQYSLMTSAGTGGSVSPGGSFVAGSSAVVSATPDATHDFAGWSGDASGTANPLSLLMDRPRAVQANFALKQFALTTAAATGGSVTPGGSYPYGTVVTLAAAADASHRFVGWAGDASGTAASVAVTMNGPKSVQALFAEKLAQTIAFAPPPDQPVGGPPLTLTAAASSGLPVSYVVLSGPAILNGNQLEITGPGAVTVQANQAGDGTFLPAPAVSRTFNAVAAAVLRYRANGRTVLQDRTTQGVVPYVLERP